MARQLAFEMPPEVRLGRADFFVSDANRAAYALIEDDALWPDGKLILAGPPGSGKSHLVRVWQTGGPARVLQAAGLASAPRPEPGARIAVEDLQHLPRGAEEALFHLHNNLAATGGRLLMTADRPPGALGIALPDLASRLAATTPARIADPDERLLTALLAKLFADRGISPKPHVLAYIAARMTRSHAEAARLVADLDRAALEAGRAINRELARAVLDKAGGPGG